MRPQEWVVAYRAVLLLRFLSGRVVGNFAIPTEVSGVPPMVDAWPEGWEVVAADGTKRPYVEDDASLVTQPRWRWLDPE